MQARLQLKKQKSDAIIHEEKGGRSYEKKHRKSHAGAGHCHMGRGLHRHFGRLGDIQPILHPDDPLRRFCTAFIRGCRKAIKEIKASTLRKGIVAGIFLFLAFAFQTFGLQGSTASTNAFLTSTNVIFVPYISWAIFRRRPTMRQILASLLCVIGISLLTLKGDAFSFGKGEFYSLMCAVFFAAHIIALDWGTKGENALAINALQMLTAGILSTACALFFDAPPRSVDMSAVLSALYLIAVSTCLAFLLQTAAQKYTSASSASLILSMESLFACIFSFLLLHEQITVMMIAGGALILASIVVVEYHPSSANIQQKSTETAG